MRCPACERELSDVPVGEVTVDVCEGGCGGIWFDHRELARLEQAHGADTAKLLEVSRDPAVELDQERKRTCPRCEETMPMKRHLFSPASKVVVDECPACGGVWLDVGELGAVADQLDPNGDKRREAERDFLAQVDKELDRARTREPAAQPHTLSTVASIFDMTSA
jgi:Zn-finger nucleic acid-binding protein